VNPRPRGPEIAAGAICRRIGPDGRLELLMVRSARWGDWSWPKGKLEPGETTPECAVREVTEETGIRPELGVPLPTVRYVLPDGRPKEVHYWAGRIHSIGPRTATADEIAEIAWLSVPAARERLTRPGDLAPLLELLHLAESGRLDTRPLLVLRHAKARSRSSWPGEEADRPLTGSGRRQARSIPGLLACWDPARLLCSPWARCVQTLQPYLDQRELDQRELDQRELDHRAEQGAPSRRPPEIVPLLSEEGLHHDPTRIGAIVDELLAGRESAVLCTHRPVLAVVVAALAAAADANARDQLPGDDPWLAPAEILVAHVSHPRRELSVVLRIHSVERYRGETARNLRPPS
jgi:8-oxo-dGTP pyrophosphatase MutT (NUDIX family)/phosphohistidine phosphatase SixA